MQLETQYRDIENNMKSKIKSLLREHSEKRAEVDAKKQISGDLWNPAPPWSEHGPSDKWRGHALPYDTEFNFDDVEYGDVEYEDDQWIEDVSVESGYDDAEMYEQSEMSDSLPRKDFQATPREKEVMGVFGKYSEDLPTYVIRYIRKNPKAIIQKLYSVYGEKMDDYISEYVNGSEIKPKPYKGPKFEMEDEEFSSDNVGMVESHIRKIINKILN